MTHAGLANESSRISLFNDPVFNNDKHDNMMTKDTRYSDVYDYHIFITDSRGKS